MIDEFTRECLVLKADRGITSADVIDSLAELFAIRGVPKHIRSDNGLEFIANELRVWLDRVGVSTLSIEPGSPRENAFAESFHSRFRDECLGQGLGSCRTRGCLPWPGPPLNPHIAWYKKPKPVRRIAKAPGRSPSPVDR
jgi:transposase InsO family protein